MTNKKWRFNRLIMSLGQVLVGVLLVINPESFTMAIIRIIGILLCVVGLISAIGYFRTKPEEAQQTQGLVKALCAFAGGLFFLLRSEWFLVTFPLLTIAFGLVILFTGIVRIQWAVDMLRMKNKRWYLAFIGAVLALVFAGFILCNPFKTTEILWKFIAVTMIINAVIDLVALIFIREISESISTELRKTGEDMQDGSRNDEVIDMDDKSIFK